MFETQHQSQVIRDYWITGSHWPTLPQVVAALRRRLDPWDGRGVRKPDEYRIVERDSKGRILRVYDVLGRLLEDGRHRQRVTRKRKLVAA